MTAYSGSRIHITGIVQGVGFRPFVYHLATSLDLKGWVINSSSGVDIEIAGSPACIGQFIDRLTSNPPPLARIDSIKITEITPPIFTDFIIRDSEPQPGEYIPVSPDVSICSDCRKELFNPQDRRYRYPFINCTNCGPRFTIIKDIPYDRPNTTMSTFKMCPDCLAEYQNPSDRRFHAQPTACPVCGPQLQFRMGEIVSVGEDAIQSARNAIVSGKILAIKGLGGYHLACDASNTKAVENLRNRKKRSDKPFALMAFDIDRIQKFAQVSQVERELLESPQHPIVILNKLVDHTILDQTAPRQNSLGFMLPYTPLHLLLLEPESGFPEILVMTSGNISEEPIAYSDDEAFTRLQGIADGFLLHDRPIHMRVDDSVCRVFVGNLYPIRRSRGYAPEPFRYSRSLPQILACGAELKNTFAFSKDKYIFISHHIGDLENYETLNSFENGIEHYKQLFRLSPAAIAVDLHPDYLSTKYGLSESFTKHLPLVSVQHHHAHLASCLADNLWPSNESVIGLIFDGTGYGTDGKIWGGEILVGNYSTFQRYYHLRETPLPGGDVAIRNPSKIALAQLFAAGIDWDPDLPPVQALCAEERTLLKSQITHLINTPQTTSMGRLFDAVSALIGIRQKATYEGQAAIELENLCDPNESSTYDLSLENGVIEILDLYPQIIQDYRRGIAKEIISARFHNTIAQTCLFAAQEIQKFTNINVVALSGGVWQNLTLLTKSLHLLKNHGFKPLIHRKIPTNDGGISIGQILVASTIING